MKDYWPLGHWPKTKAGQMIDAFKARRIAVRGRVDINRKVQEAYAVTQYLMPADDYTTRPKQPRNVEAKGLSFFEALALVRRWAAGWLGGR